MPIFLGLTIITVASLVFSICTFVIITALIKAYDWLRETITQMCQVGQSTRKKAPTKSEKRSLSDQLLGDDDND